MIVAGIGCRRGVTKDLIVCLIEEALAQATLYPAYRLGALATAAFKRDEEGIHQAAEALKVCVLYFDNQALEAQSQQTLTPSAPVMAHVGVPSVAEAAALCAAGSTGRLLLPRLARHGVTCALALRSDLEATIGSD